jgi:hypothetical protein
VAVVLDAERLNHSSTNANNAARTSQSGLAGRFDDPAHPHFHPEDIEIALDIDRYDFAVRVHFENGRPVVRMEKRARR